MGAHGSRHKTPLAKFRAHRGNYLRAKQNFRNYMDDMYEKGVEKPNDDDFDGMVLYGAMVKYREKRDHYGRLAGIRGPWMEEK